MPIETLPDWNSRLLACGCCGLHECVAPLFFLETSNHATSHVSHFSSGTFYTSRLRSYSAGGSVETFWDVNFETSLKSTPATEIRIPPLTGILTETYNGDNTPAESRENGIDYLLENFDWEDPNPRPDLCGGTFSSSGPITFSAVVASTVYRDRFPSFCGFLMAQLAFKRWRWQVPLNSVFPTPKRYKYYKITWDVVFFPADEDEDPVVESEDNVWENELDSDDLSDTGFSSPWYELAPPEEEGERRVVNVRYSCYRETPYGSKPQIIGESFPAS
jgi:hypothetical protein